MSALRRRLRVGEIVPALVERVLGEGHYAVLVRGETVHAQSDLLLAGGVLYAVVEALRPKIRLRLIPLQSERSAEAMIRLADRHHLPLDVFAQQVLMTLLEADTLPANPGGFLADCRKLAALRPVASEIAWSALLRFCVFAPDPQAALNALLYLYARRDTLLPEPFDLPVPDEDALRFAWVFLRLDGATDHWRLAIPDDPLRTRLEGLHALLGALNAALAGVNVQVWLLPEAGRLRLMPVELQCAGGVCTCRAWARGEMLGEVRVQVQWGGGMARAALGFANSLAAGMFTGDVPALGALANGCGLPLRELRLEVERPAGGAA